MYVCLACINYRSKNHKAELTSFPQDICMAMSLLSKSLSISVRGSSLLHNVLYHRDQKDDEHVLRQDPNVFNRFAPSLIPSVYDTSLQGLVG